jgi:hypothetical protein
MLAGASVVVGYLAGMLCLLLLCWRRLTRPSDECASALRRECRDLRETVARMRRDRDEQVAVLAGLYEQNNKLARRLVDEVGRCPQRPA